MVRFGSLFVLLILSGLFGCEREKRVQQVPSSTLSVTERAAEQPLPLIDEAGWLAVFARNADGLAQFAEGSTLWGSLLQGRYVDVLTSYDDLRKSAPADALVCARASLELAATSLVLEELLQSIQGRVIEIQASRAGVDKVAVLRAFFEAQAETKLNLEMPVWASERPTFLDESMTQDHIKVPGTSAYQSRWALFAKFATGQKLAKTRTFLKRTARLTDPDFKSGSGEAAFEFVDLAVAGASRHFFARKALECLSNIDSEADLLKVRALKLSGDTQGAIDVIRNHKVPKVLSVGIQLLTLDTSVAAYEQSLYVEGVQLGMNAGTVEPSLFPRTIPLSQLRMGLAVGHGSNDSVKQTITVQRFDPVILSRSILKLLNKGVVSDEATASTLISRYVDEVLRQTADVHFLKGEFARSAQVRRRIGGTSAFVVGPKVPPSALAKCALEHWKIVEPRSAIRYLKDLGSVFPNANRSAGLLRDVLSYRARQSGGQTAAGQ